jgi:putative membrane protein insertion efficiency factor
LRTSKPITVPRSGATMLGRSGQRVNGKFPQRLTTAPATLLLLALRAYKVAFSPFYTGSCRYLPSCSDYGIEAVERHGAVYGGWLTLRRVSRCHPFASSGLDPVPPEPERVGSGIRGFSGS